MTSFPARARRVRDRTRPTQRRLFALRECALRFAPYGFRATWHHLVINARVPHTLDDDPGSLVRAVDELERARDLLLPYVSAYAARRRQEKAAGIRAPSRPVPWCGVGWRQLAYCPDPEHHPNQRLAVVVRRILDRHAVGVDARERCLACDTPHRRPNRACPTCGVLPWTTPAPRGDASTSERWRLIWNRTVNR